MRKFLERIFLKSVRFYTFNTPIKKGKYRLYQIALNLCHFPPTKTEAKTRDGRRYSVDLTSKMHESVYFIGEYERAVTDLISAIVKTGDVCLDVGANFGWYSMLFHRLSASGAKNSVHSFEPMPDVYANLRKNWELAGKPENVVLNNLALGDENRSVELYRFNNLPNGYSSLSTMGKSDFETFSVPMLTLNSYLADKKIENVNFIKLDIEGAELMFLHGATELFKQQIPPFFIVEMALGTTQSFGYLPENLIEFFRRHADYRFYRLNDIDGSLTEMKGFAPEDPGAHILCVPRNCEPERLKNLNIVG